MDATSSGVAPALALQHPTHLEHSSPIALFPAHNRATIGYYPLVDTMTANLVRLCSHPVWLDLSINGPPMRSSYCQHIIRHILQQATQSRTQREGTIINTPTTWTIFVDTQDAERQVGYGGLSPVYERRLHLRKPKREDVTSMPTETLSLRSLPAIRTNSLKEHIVCGLCPRAPTTDACSKCSTRVCQRCIVARTMLCRVC